MKTFTITDTRFLAVHPRTELWWEQREQCWICINATRTDTMLTCDAVARDGNNFDRTCISARDEGGPCGPSAKLFRLNEAVL